MSYNKYYYFEGRLHVGIFGPEKPVWIEGRLFTTIHGVYLQAKLLISYREETDKEVWRHLSKEEYESKLYK